MVQIATIQGRVQAAADRCEVVQVLPGPAELDLATADSLVARGYAALDRRPGVLLLDLAGMCFADACGLSALVRIANRAEAAGCLYDLIAPQPLVARLLRITLLDRRLPVFATVGDARARLIPHVSAAMPGAPARTQGQRARGPEAARQQPAGHCSALGEITRESGIHVGGLDLTMGAEGDCMPRPETARAAFRTVLGERAEDGAIARLLAS